MTSREKPRRRGRGAVRTIGIYAGLIVTSSIMMLPFLYSFVTAFKSPADFARSSPLSLPDPWSLDSFAAMLGGRVDLGRALLITLASVVVVVVFQVGSSILAAYAFARLTFPGRDVVFWIFLSTLMIPGTVLVIPLYLMMAGAGLKDTFAGLVLPFLFASPYAVFLLREYFRGIPQDLIDAARLDGSGNLRILSHIVVPVSTPIIVTILLITVVSGTASCGRASSRARRSPCSPSRPRPCRRSTRRTGRMSWRPRRSRSCRSSSCSSCSRSRSCARSPSRE